MSEDLRPFNYLDKLEAVLANSPDTDYYDRDDHEETVDEAYDSGFNEGYQEGITDAMEFFKEEFDILEIDGKLDLSTEEGNNLLRLAIDKRIDVLSKKIADLQRQRLTLD